MSELPSGTVTFLFSDIEGSTRLLQEVGDAYADLLADHRRRLREVFARHGGIELGTQGDSFFVVFSRASGALAAAAEAHEVLRDGPIRVRVGLHTGEPLLTEEGYVGIDVHRAARIAAAGHGGQTLVSRSTRDLLRSEQLRDLGSHRLKDLVAPERIYQVGERAFSPLKTVDRTNLPVTATPLVGRRRELDELVELLCGDSRLVTITGAGGSGKTRLALQVAADLADHFRDGVLFVSLAPVQDAALLNSTIVQAAGVRAVEDLCELEVLLLLDNLEHLLPAASALSALLLASAHVKLLVTSRVRLNVSAEIEYPLEPFADDEAVEFFVERARAVRRDVRGDAAVGEICRRLDGLPLALELAASRVKVLDPPLLLERLGQRLPVLTGGGRDVPKRQQTLRATIEWSYLLLEERVQAAFRRLAVFAGSFSLEAAERAAWVELDELAALVDWSLIKPVGEGRFLMLETIREYARELLDASADFAEVRRRHVDYVLALVEEAEPELTGPNQREWYQRLATEQANVREALTYACDSGDGERALMIAGTIWRFWWTRGPVDEPEHWYERVFAVADDASELALARATFGAAHVAESRGDAELAKRQFAEAADRLRQVGETRWLILALTHLAGAYGELGDSARGDELNQEALEIALENGDVRGAAVVRVNLAWDLRNRGEYERAHELVKEALAASRILGDDHMIAGCLVDLAQLALETGALDEATPTLRESLKLYAAIGNTHHLAEAIAVGATALLARGDASTSARLAAATTALCNSHGFALDPWTRRRLDETLTAARSDLGDHFEEAWRSGAELEPEAAAELALGSLSAPP